MKKCSSSGSTTGYGWNFAFIPTKCINLPSNCVFLAFSSGLAPNLAWKPSCDAKLMRFLLDFASNSPDVVSTCWCLCRASFQDEVAPFKKNFISPAVYSTFNSVKKTIDAIAGTVLEDHHDRDPEPSGNALVPRDHHCHQSTLFSWKNGGDPLFLQIFFLPVFAPNQVEGTCVHTHPKKRISKKLSDDQLFVQLVPKWISSKMKKKVVFLAVMQ